MRIIKIRVGQSWCSPCDIIILLRSILWLVFFARPAWNDVFCFLPVRISLFLHLPQLHGALHIYIQTFVIWFTLSVFALIENWNRHVYGCCFNCKTNLVVVVYCSDFFRRIFNIRNYRCTYDLFWFSNLYSPVPPCVSSIMQL